MKPFFLSRVCVTQLLSLNILIILFLVFGLSACGDTKGAANKPNIEEFTFGKSLYVTNAGDGSLLAFDPLAINTKSKAVSQKPVPRVSEGNISPSRRFPDAFNNPAGIYLDKTNDTLYLANAGQNSISIYENISTLKPPAAATRVISGSQTLLNQPFGLAYDATRSRLYVANRDGNTVVAFDSSCIDGAALQGNISPCSLLRLAGDDKPAQLDLPRAVAIDTQRDILYISNMGSDSILVYDHASTSLGDVPSACITDFTPCNEVPDRMISPHAEAENVSKLELPFGIFIDSVSDRLYVVNTGLNTPGILIYENAGRRDGGVVPERVITSQIAQLPPSCSPASNPTPTLPLPPECRLTQLTVPTGIDVDVDGDRIFIINNNSPNNVNGSSSANVDSPTLIVFNNINTRCPLGGSRICPLNPDRRVGGDVSAEAGATLSAPLGVAIDPLREITYVANTGGNNLLSYSLAGNIAPIKRNASVDTIEDKTKLEEPTSFFYDEGNDRLYVTNHIRSFVNNRAVVVYDQVSKTGFTNGPSNIPPSWTIEKDTRFNLLRGFHVDQQQGYLLVLSGSSGPRLSIYCIPRTDGTFNAPCASSPLFNMLWTEFPGSDPNVPLRPPNAFMDFNPGFGVSGPVSMAVDVSQGDVYIVDKVNKTIYVFNLNSLTHTRTITSANFNLPHGVAVDATKNILYVTDVGNNEILSFSGASGLTINAVASKVVTTTLPAADALGNPISPFIDSVSDRLYLINLDTDAIFSYDDASTNTGETAPSGIISGLNTLLDFAPPVNPTAFTGALIVAKQNGNQTLFVGQPVSSDCEDPGTPTCQPGALLIYGIQGRVAPSKVFLGGGGEFVSPSGVAVDGDRKTLYVANQETNTLSILTNADTLDVNIPATAKIDLGNIQLNRPAGLAVDPAQNMLFVSNSGTTNCTVGPCNAVLVFKKPDVLVNGTAPDQILTHTQLSDPRGLALDPAKARLYVASRGGNAILVYNMGGGTAALGAILSGAGSQVNQPISVAVDTKNDILYVLNEADKEVLVFEGAAALSGGESPTRVITGRNGEGLNMFRALSAIAVDPANDVLYIADEVAQAVYIVLDASTRQGQAVDKTLAGDKTGLFTPTALAVDTSQ